MFYNMFVFEAFLLIFLYVESLSNFIHSTAAVNMAGLATTSFWV
jgi:hypothetical protein